MGFNDEVYKALTKVVYTTVGSPDPETTKVEGMEQVVEMLQRSDKRIELDVEHWSHLSDGVAVRATCWGDCGFYNIEVLLYVNDEQCVEAVFKKVVV